MDGGPILRVWPAAIDASASRATSAKRRTPVKWPKRRSERVAVRPRCDGIRHGAAQEAARARGIDDHLRPHLAGLALAIGPEPNPVAREGDRRHLRAVPIVDPHSLRPPHEMVVHVRAKPVRVGHALVRAGGDEQPGMVAFIVHIRLSGPMTVEAEPSLEAPSQLREMLDPPAVSRQVPQIRLVVVIGQALETKAGQRSRRLADGEAWVPAPLDEGDREPLVGQQPGQQRARESRSDDDDLGTVRSRTRFAFRARSARPSGSILPVRFIRPRRSRRDGRQTAQAARRPASHRSATTTPPRRRRAPSKAASRSRRLGAWNSPPSASRSISPFPPRAGMSATTPRPDREHAQPSERPTGRSPPEARRARPRARRRARRCPRPAGARPPARSRRGHALVEPLQRVRVDRLEAHRDLEPPLNRSANSRHASPTRSGWHSTVTPANGRSRSARIGHVGGGTARLEEIARVVELDPARLARRTASSARAIRDLGRQSPERRRAGPGCSARDRRRRT